MQSTYENSIKTTFGQLDQKFILENITEITFGPLDQKWSFFMLVFEENVFAIISVAPPVLAEAFQIK